MRLSRHTYKHKVKYNKMDTQNPLFAKFDQVLGKTTPTTTTGPVSSRADEIRALDTSPSPDNVAEQRREETKTNIKSSFHDSMEKIKSSYLGARQADQSNVGIVEKTGKQLESGLGIASGVASAVSSPFTGVLKTFMDEMIANNPTMQELTNSPVVSKALDTINAPLNHIVEKHPELAQNLGDILNIFLTTLGAQELPGQIKDFGNASFDIAKNADSATQEIASNIKKGAVNAKNTIVNKFTGEPTDPIVKLQETISPKITSKETQAIINEGRLTRGKESTIFGKQPDIVTQSENVQRAAKVINESIPNSSSMNDAELSKAIDTHIESTAKKLKPVMKSTPITKETTGKVVDSWKTLKAEQQAQPEFLDNESGNKAFQGKFENYLKKLEWDITDTSGKFKSPTPKTMDDIWETRIAYDSSIPDNVKNATSNSSPILQTRKAMWLENRAILNSAINDTYKGLGAESQDAFARMSDMYDARQNIATKAKIDLKGTEGVLPTTKVGWLKLAGGAGATLLGIDYALHKVGL
jgi:hypothetical protein